MSDKTCGVLFCSAHFFAMFGVKVDCENCRTKEVWVPVEATVKLELATPVSDPSVAVIAVVSAFFRVVVKVVVDWPLP